MGAADAVVRVVWGTATGPTELAAYDAALAAAGVANYNLVTVSSVVPAGARVDPVGTAPDLGSAGNRLTVVQARATVGPDDDAAAASAGLAWATGPGPGLFYEVGGRIDAADCRRRLETGLDAGTALRDWTFDDRGEHVERVDAPETGYGVAVVLGAYGESEPIL